MELITSLFEYLSDEWNDGRSTDEPNAWLNMAKEKSYKSQYGKTTTVAAAAAAVKENDV